MLRVLLLTLAIVTGAPVDGASLGTEGVSLFARPLLHALWTSADVAAAGVALALSGVASDACVTLAIAACCALGAAAAAFIGNTLITALPCYTIALATSLLFAWLGWTEYCAWIDDSRPSLARLPAESLALRVAAPLALNNLAGGFGGVDPSDAQHPCAGAIGVLVITYVAMCAGHFVGSACFLHSPRDPRLGAASVFGVLAILPLLDVILSTSTLQ